MNMRDLSAYMVFSEIMDSPDLPSTLPGADEHVRPLVDWDLVAELGCVALFFALFICLLRAPV